MTSGNVPADRMTAEAVYPSLTLLEVDGVGGRVPVDDG
jgi:hypothetical protein